MKRCLGSALLLTSAAVIGCGDLAGHDQDDSGRCPQTYEFGNYGCAAILGKVYGPDGQAAALASRPNSILLVSLSSLRSSAELYDVRPPADDGRYALTATRFAGPPTTTPDTVTVRIVALWLDRPPNWPVGTPLPVFATDTVLRTLELVAVGSRFHVDTIDLHLRPPGP